MKQLTEWILTELDINESSIKNVIAIYPGRFQPMGAHHAKTYEWLAKQFGKNNTYVATSDKVELPKSPFNFNEKKKIINSHGITNVVHTKNPYVADEILKKYDPSTTAVVFMYGAKDAGRLRTTKKDGSPGYYQPYDKNKNNLKGYDQHGYFVIAPHVSMNVPGFGEMSGTEIRKALGSDRPDKEKIFKGIFGHTNKSIYNIVVPKLEKLSETITKFVSQRNIHKLLSEGSTATRQSGDDVDDGPRYFYGHRKAYETLTKEMAERLGYAVVDWILGDTKTMDFRNPYPKGPVRAVSYFPSGVAGVNTPTNQVDYKGTKAYREWQKHIKRVAGILGMEFVNWLDAEESKDKTIKEPNTIDKHPNIAESLIKEASPLDKKLTWTDKESGKKKSGTARSVLRTGDDSHPAWDKAERLKTQDTKSKEREAEVEKERDKAGTEKEKEKEKDTSKPVSDKEKQQIAKNLGYSKPEDMLTPGEKKTIDTQDDWTEGKDGWEILDDERSKVKNIRDYTDEEYQGETGEYFENNVTKNVAPNAFKDESELIQKMKDAKPIYLSSEELQNMGNTDVGEILSASEEGGSDAMKARGKELADEYGKDWDRLEKGITKGNDVPAPIALRDKNGDLHLMAGNTRLMSFTAYGKKLPVKVIDYDGEFQYDKTDVEFTPDGDTPKDTKFTAHKKLIKSAKEGFKKLSDSEKQMFRKLPEQKRSFGEALLNKAKSIPKALKETFTHKVHVYKETAVATGKLLSGKSLDKHDKSALKQFAIDAAILSGMVASGGTGVGAAGFAKVVATKMATMWVKDISILGIGRAALFAGKENLTEDELLTKATEHFATWLQTKKLTQDDYLQMLADYQPETNETFSKDWWQDIVEEIMLPVEIGDTVYMGKFKNKPVVVKDIAWNEKGDLTINGKSALRMRIKKQTNESLTLKESKQKYYHTTSVKLPNSFVVKQNVSAKTKAAMLDDYGIEDFPGGLFVSELPEYSKLYGKYTYEIEAREEPPMLDWGKYIFPNGTRVKAKLVSTNESLTEGLLLEGGAYGHMNHPFDDANLKFADLKRMIDLGLQGKLDVEQSVTEKTDGQNLMITWKDGKLKAARNKATLIDPMDINAVKSKFAGRGDIEKAFVFAMKDLQNAIGKLSDKQLDKIFKGGRAFMNLEIIYPATENVIVYDTAVLQFHGAIEYDNKGNIIGPVKDSGRMLQGMIAQVNADIQKNFKIIKPHVLSIKPHNDYTTKRDYFFGKLKKLQKEFNLKDEDTLGMYHQMWWESFIRKQANKTNYIVPNNVMEGLIRRWAFWDKGYSVTDMKRDIKDPKFLEWVITYDKTDHSSQVKDNMYPFETLIFEVGTEILKNVENYLTASPDRAIQKIKDEVHAVAKEIEKGGDLKKIDKLKKQLARIEAAGGLDKVVPSEGIVFWYGGKQWKVSGVFGPINQILGTLKFAK